MQKDLFVETINKLKQQYDHDTECSELLGKIYCNAFTANLTYKNSFLSEQLIKILQEQLQDNHDQSWIEYFMFELDFGKKKGNNSAWRKDGSVIDLSDAGKLYDFLIENLK